MTKAQLLKLYTEVYELNGGGWLVKTKTGQFIALDSSGQPIKQ